MPAELLLEIRGGHFPFGGKAMEHQILEQHEQHPARKERGLYWARGVNFIFIFLG